MTGSSRLVVEHLLRFGPLSRAELSRSLDLSRASLTRLTKPLVRSGLLVEPGEERQAQTGRAARLLDVVEGAHSFVGVNLTGDTAFGVLTDLRARPVRYATVELVDRSPSAVVEAVTDLVESLRSTGPDVLGVGVSLGGLVEERRLVVSTGFLGWEARVDLAGPLAETLGTPVVVDNDLVSVTRGEHWFGAGREHSHFAVLTIGAGVGFGLVVHDRIVSSPDQGLGLIADIQLDPQGPRCPAGHRGCGTAMLTTGSIRRQVAVALDRELSWDQVMDLAAHGDPVAAGVVADSGRALGRLVGQIANIAMPPVIVLAGEGVSLAHVAAEHMSEGLHASRDPRATPVDLRIREHDFRTWARGAAASSIEDYVDSRITGAPDRRADT